MLTQRYYFYAIFLKFGGQTGKSVQSSTRYLNNRQTSQLGSGAFVFQSLGSIPDRGEFLDDLFVASFRVFLDGIQAVRVSSIRTSLKNNPYYAYWCQCGMELFPNILQHYTSRYLVGYLIPIYLFLQSCWHHIEIPSPFYIFFTFPHPLVRLDYLIFLLQLQQSHATCLGKNIHAVFCSVSSNICVC